ncbi:MAG: LuxR C-terminal-related transcriptional regulator [Desulfitobacteriia bacterium]
MQILVKETFPDTTLAAFLRAAMARAGADRGFLILEQVGELFIEAEQENCSASPKTAALIPLEQCTKLSRAIVRYVDRSLQTVVLNQPQHKGIFARDSYFLNSQAQSIVCLPLFFQGIPSGVLYLENTMMPGVFLADRVEDLKSICAQSPYVKSLQIFLGPDIPKFRPPVPLAQLPLTALELDVVLLIAEGLSNKEIAQRLGVSLSSVKRHILNVYGKLQVNRRVQVVTMAAELGLLSSW